MRLRRYQPCFKPINCYLISFHPPDNPRRPHICHSLDEEWQSQGAQHWGACPRQPLTASAPAWRRAPLAPRHPLVPGTPQGTQTLHLVGKCVIRMARAPENRPGGQEKHLAQLRGQRSLSERQYRAKADGTGGGLLGEGRGRQAVGHTGGWVRLSLTRVRNALKSALRSLDSLGEGR